AGACTSRVLPSQVILRKVIRLSRYYFHPVALHPVSLRYAISEQSPPAAPTEQDTLNCLEEASTAHPFLDHDGLGRQGRVPQPERLTEVSAAARCCRTWARTPDSRAGRVR